MRRLALAALLASCTLGAIAAEAVAPALPAARVVQVNGSGEASGAPDRARLSVAVEARNIDLRTAEAKVNEVVRAYLAEARALGAKDADINTAGYSVNPEYDWVENRQKFRGYHALRQVEITVRDLGKLGDFLLRATKAGVNQVNPPVLESSQQKTIEREALKAATEDARAQAEVIAKALGMKLGGVRSINANAQGYQPPVPMPKVMMAMRSDAVQQEVSGNEQMGFSGGQIRATASVTAEFELLP